MHIVNIHDAKTQFSKLIEAVESGQEIVIARAGKPAARLVPIRIEATERKPGTTSKCANVRIAMTLRE